MREKIRKAVAWGCRRAADGGGAAAAVQRGAVRRGGEGARGRVQRAAADPRRRPRHRQPGALTIDESSAPPPAPDQPTRSTIACPQSLIEFFSHRPFYGRDYVVSDRTTVRHVGDAGLVQCLLLLLRIGVYVQLTVVGAMLYS